MNYNEYTAEYQKVILKESLRMGLKNKGKIINIIKLIDDKRTLNRLLKTNVFEDMIASNEIMLGKLGNDEELIDLIEQDTVLIQILRKTVEDRLRELQEKENEEYVTQEENDYEEQDEYSSNARKAKERDGTIDSTIIKEDEETHHLKCEPYAMHIKYGPVLSFLKMSAIAHINLIRDAKMLLDESHSQETLRYMSKTRHIYDEEARKTAQMYIDMPECDRELKMLAEQIVLEGKRVIEALDRYIEENEQSYKQDTGDNSQNENTLEVQKEPDEINSPTKSPWELSTEEKKAIQGRTAEIAQNHTEEGNIKQEEPVVEGGEYSEYR